MRGLPPSRVARAGVVLTEGCHSTNVNGGHRFIGCMVPGNLALGLNIGQYYRTAYAALHVLDRVGEMSTSVKALLSTRISPFLAVTAGALIAAPWSHTELRSEGCQAVEIEEAGRYLVRSSTIRGIGTTHNRAGVAFLISIWPPPGNSSDSDIEEIDVMASRTSDAGPDCRRGLPHPRENLVVCSENIPGFARLLGLVRFKMGGAENYEQRTESIVKYLATEALGCETAGQRI